MRQSSRLANLLQAKSYFLDDMVIVVMKGGRREPRRRCFTAAKKNRAASFARVFENQTSQRLSDITEELTGRNVISYQSQIMFSAGHVVEIFVLSSAPSAAA